MKFFLLIEKVVTVKKLKLHKSWSNLLPLFERLVSLLLWMLFFSSISNKHRSCYTILWDISIDCVVDFRATYLLCSAQFIAKKKNVSIEYYISDRNFVVLILTEYVHLPCVVHPNRVIAMGSSILGTEINMYFNLWIIETLSRPNNIYIFIEHKIVTHSFVSFYLSWLKPEFICNTFVYFFCTYDSFSSSTLSVIARLTSPKASTFY